MHDGFTTDLQGRDWDTFDIRLPGLMDIKEAVFLLIRSVVMKLFRHPKL